MKKILSFTSIRSDYDLMVGLYKLLNDDPTIDFRIVVSGAHLSKKYGYSVAEIEKCGFNIIAKIETLLDSDSKPARVKSAGILLLSIIDIVNSFQPDLILITGDREDVIVVAMVASYLEIKSIHFYSGDHGEDGYIDNLIRHSTSKLATYHFVTLAEHKKRLVRIGENPKNIHIVGNMSLDNFLTHKVYDLQFMSDYFGKNLHEKYAVVIFHPVSTEREPPELYFENILLALKNNGIVGVVGYPNVDPGNFSIISIIEKYTQDSNFLFYKNLPRDIFISLYKHASFMIGNSSSGICESASIPIPVINVGMRQTSRASSGNVNFCDGNFEAISLAIKQALDPKYVADILKIKNIYGDGNSSIKAYRLIVDNVLSAHYDYKPTDPLKIDWI